MKINRVVGKVLLFCTLIGALALAGCGAVSDVTAQLSKPSAPTSVTATAGNNQITVNWAGVSGAIAYKVYRSSAPGVVLGSATTNVSSSTSFTDTGLTNGTTYYYVVTANNVIGESSISAEVSATPLASIAIVTVSQTGATAASVSVLSSDGAAKATIPTGTILYSDSGKTIPVTGSVTVTASTIKSLSALPTAAQTGLLVGVGTQIDTISILADITMNSGATAVKAFDAPITVNIKLPAGYTVGSAVDYFSVSSTGSWTKEGTATVKPDGSIDMFVTHLSLWGVGSFKNGVTAAMMSGKTYTFFYTYNNSSGTVIGNADHTISMVGSSITGTWSINSSGQLITALKTSPTNIETDTFTLTSATSTTIVGTQTWKNSSNANTGTGTMTFTLVN